MSKINYDDLKQVIPHKWRVQSYTKPDKNGKCYAIFVGYIDARDAMDLLDKVVGPDNWSDEYHRGSKGELVCRVSITDGDRTQHKEDTGTESNRDQTKGEYSDAFKRACVKWGIGRFLYDLPRTIMHAVVTGTDKKGRAMYAILSKEGKVIKDRDVSDYIIKQMSLHKGTSKPKQQQSRKVSVVGTKITLPEKRPCKCGGTQTIKQWKNKGGNPMISYFCDTHGAAHVSHVKQKDGSILFGTLKFITS